jgi:hypothetical protein
MTYYEAALQILRSAKRPLTSREIFNRAVEKGLITAGGKTPRSTLGAALHKHLNDNPDLVKLEDLDPEGKRAKRGTVYWTLRHASAATQEEENWTTVNQPGIVTAT